MGNADIVDSSISTMVRDDVVETIRMMVNEELDKTLSEDEGESTRHCFVHRVNCELF
jgi:hypothetical protein